MAGVISRFSGQHEFLSNFYNSPVTMRQAGVDKVFPTAEHAFQSMKMLAMGKSGRDEYVQAILDAPTPAKAKYAGRSVTIDLDKWESIKDSCMRQVVFAKFTENDDLREQLLSTGASLLVEGNDWGDTYWGRCEGKGRNILGSILMEVRGYYHYVGLIGKPLKSDELQARLLMGW